MPLANLYNIGLRFKKRHAQVWQTIHVKRDVATRSVVHENDVEQERSFFYSVFSGQNEERHTPKAILKAPFGKDDITGQWDSVYEYEEMVNPDGSPLGTAINFHNYQFDQYGETETDDYIVQ